MWVFVILVAVPIIEIALFLQIGGILGFWATLGVVILSAAVGSWLLRSQGKAAMGRLRQSVERMDDPTEPIASGAMILLCGALLLTPGFFTRRYSKKKRTEFTTGKKTFTSNFADL